LRQCVARKLAQGAAGKCDSQTSPVRSAGQRFVAVCRCSPGVKVSLRLS
jgi:hypothetical protein